MLVLNKLFDSQQHLFVEFLQVKKIFKIASQRFVNFLKNFLHEIREVLLMS